MTDTTYAPLTEVTAPAAPRGNGRASPPGPTITASPFVWRDPTLIPRRQWLYGFHYIRQFVSCTVSPGAVGKSSLTIIEALAMVTGRELLGVRPQKRCKVWLWNGEDPAEETERRIAAACIHFGISAADLAGHLFVDSGRDTEIIMGVETKDGTMIVKPIVAAMTATILANQIDVVVIDPFVSSHRVTENDNNAIDMVVKAWAGIAHRCNCSIELVHHSRKTGGNEVTVEDGRGAVALLNAARSARALNGMTKDEAEKAGVEKPRTYFRVDTGKANLAPPPDKAAWHHLASVPLGNGDTPEEPGDFVAVVEPWQWPDPLQDLSTADLDLVLQRVRAGRWRADLQAKDWVGKAVAEALGLDLEDRAQKSKVKGCIAIWKANRALKEIDGKDDKGNVRKFIVAGDV